MFLIGQKSTLRAETKATKRAAKKLLRQCRRKREKLEKMIAKLQK